jgi:hypothetical protein
LNVDAGVTRVEQPSDGARRTSPTPISYRRKHELVEGEPADDGDFLSGPWAHPTVSVSAKAAEA